MAITRRQFIKRSGVVAASSLLGPSLFGNMFVRQAMADIGNRYLVVLFLDGGNDGLNTVVPVTNGGATLRTAYEAARSSGAGGLRLTPGELGPYSLGLDTSGAQVALHPGLAGLKTLYDAGHVAVIQGCGYPDYNLSHEESRVIWQSANPLRLGSLSGTGWAGRHLAQQYGSTDIPGVTIADAVAAEYRQTATSVLAVRRVRFFGFPYDDEYPGDITRKRTAFDALCAAAGTGSGQQASQIYVGDSGGATLLSSESYGGEDPGSLHYEYQNDRDTWSDQYEALNTSTSRNLREVAKIIYGVESGAPNVNARFFQLANGGYDTHSDQGSGTGQHYDLHREVGDAIQVFYNDVANMGAGSRVLIMVWSEFSRRIEQNANGTDHGSQGPMFVIGGAVNHGLYGKHPNINASALDDDGNTVYTQGLPSVAFRSTDFRDVYGTILKQWLQIPQATITSSILPLDSGPAASYWTAANFNMGFLPVVIP